MVNMCQCGIEGRRFICEEMHKNLLTGEKNL